MINIPFAKEGIIRRFIKKSNCVVYGARAMNAQLKPRAFGVSLFGRSTDDWDLFSKTPKANARKLEKNLDRNYGGNYFYTKPALHPGTWKVIDIGPDNKRGTDDDYGVADITKPTRKIRTVTIGGIKYAHLSEREKDARRALMQKQYAFRAEKDKEDLARIKLSRRFK